MLSRLIFLLIALSAPALSQVCTAFVANQPILRQEGASEPAGDILITCNGSPYSTQSGAQTLTVSVDNAAITSRHLTTNAGSSSSIPTEAALLYNDCLTNSGTSSNGLSCVPSGEFPGGTPIKGFLQNGALVFSGFMFPNTGQVFQLRITNIRVNANELSPGSFVTATVLATFAIANQQNLVLGAVQSSLSLSVSGPASTQQCGNQVQVVNSLTIRELVNTAFKTPASTSANLTPGQWYQANTNTESQTVIPMPSGWTNQVSGAVPGQADAGTRFRVNLINVPAGVSISFPTVVGNAASQIVYSPNGDLGPFLAVPGPGISLSSAGSVTYEVRAQNLQSIDSFTIPIGITADSISAAGTILISATYAPTTLETGSVEPRFADTSLSVPLINILSCLPATHLAFSNQPTGGTAGTAIGPVSVQAVDALGNVTGTNPLVTLTSTPAAINASLAASAGIATFSTLTFGNPGTYTLTASASSLAPVTSNSFIVRGPVNITVSSSSSNPQLGQPVTLTATISPTLATGAVTFYDAATVLGTATLSGGQAAISILLPAGPHNIKASYAGSNAYSPGVSANISVIVASRTAASFISGGNLNFASGPSFVTTGDLNGDGIADLVVVSNGGSNIAVLLGARNGTFQTPAFYATGNQPQSIVISDLNLDGKPDLLVANGGDGTVSILLGKGDGTFGKATAMAVGTSPSSLAIADFNNDGIPDFAVAKDVSSGNTLSIFIGNGNGTFQPPVSYATGSAPSSMAVADLNRDGYPDIVLANLNANTVSVLLGNSDGTLQAPVNYPYGNGPDCLAIADFNGDAIPDIVVGNLYSNTYDVLLGKGDGTLQFRDENSAGAGPRSVTVGDFNGDGKVDLAFADINGSSISLVLGLGDGRFQAVQTYITGAGPQSLVATDFDGDGRTDLAVANLNANAVSILLGSNASPISIAGGIFGGVGGRVTVTLSGTQNATTITDLGSYAFYGLSPTGTYTVTPSLSFYVFGPPSQSVTNPVGTVTMNFSGASSPPGSVTVYGRITAAGVGLGGVGVSVNGSMNLTSNVFAAGSITTDPSGDYVITVPKNGNYTLSPAKVGYTFTPPVTFTNLNTDQVLNFTGIAQTGLQFYPVTPCRIADTRTAAGFTGPFGPPSMPAGSTRTFPVQASACGIPSNAAAYSLNFTVVPTGPLGNLTTWPTGKAMPNVSTLNDPTGTVIANAAIVPAGTNGSIDIYVTHAIDVLFDINGYFAPPSANSLQFYAVTPCRIADTRTVAGFTGQFGPPSLAAGTARSFNLPQSPCRTPANAQAYSLNFTVIPKTTLGVLTTWPAGQPMPNASTLNSYTGTVVANAAIVPAGTNGSISAWANDDTDLLIDINGYFAPASTSGYDFYPMTPCRIADTRAAAGFTTWFGPPSLIADRERTFPVASSACEVPVRSFPGPIVAAYSLNLTVIPPGPLGVLIALPSNSTRPNVSTLNSYNGNIVANAAIVPVSTFGSINLYVNAPTDVLFDINGYFGRTQ